jgi:hypothetical protein
VSIEELAERIREAWVASCLETGDAKPSHLAPWAELGAWDREADRRIARAVVLALRDVLGPATRDDDSPGWEHRQGVARRIWDDLIAEAEGRTADDRIVCCRRCGTMLEIVADEWACPNGCTSGAIVPEWAPTPKQRLAAYRAATNEESTS